MLEGVIPVMPTPYRENGEIDLPIVRELVKWYAKASCHGVLVSGSGGEMPYLSLDERIALVRTAVEAGDGLPVMCGIGAMSAKQAEREIVDVISAGASYVLVAMLTYYPVGENEALDYYRRVAEASKSRALYYHFPQATGFDPGAQTVAKICNLAGIIGAKMSRPNLKEISDVIRGVKNQNFALFSGTILLMEEVMKLGGRGVIGILPAVFPDESVKWYNAIKNADEAQRTFYANKVKRAINLLAGFGANPSVQLGGLKLLSRLPFVLSAGEYSPHAAIKEALRLRGFPIKPIVRNPLPPLDEKTKRKVYNLMRRLGFVANK